MSQQFWIGTVSKEHVLRGKAAGFAQVCHGKEAPLKRMRAHDLLFYYSPNERFNEKTPYQCFTALGIIQPRETYQVKMTRTCLKNSDFVFSQGVGSSSSAVYTGVNEQHRRTYNAESTQKSIFETGSNDFTPFRRDVSYLVTHDAPIRPLLSKLSFIHDKIRWGAAFRFGILKIPRDDVIIIATAMGLTHDKIDELFV